MVHNAFHHEHSHGRVFHGLEARNMLPAEKRDSHGDSIKRNALDDNKARFIHNLPQGAQKQAAGKGGNPVNVETVYSQVIVTETPGAPQPTPTDGKHATAGGATSLSPAQASYLSAKSQAQAPNTAQSSSVAPSPSPTQVKGYPIQRHGTTSSTVQPSQQAGTPLQHTQSSSAAVNSASVQANQVVGTPLTHTSGPTAVVGTPLNAANSNNLIGQKSEGMSSGAKAGLAFGILILIALAGGLVFFCWRRRKQQKDRGLERLDEKRATQDSFFGGTTAAATRGPQRESVQSEKSFQSTRTAATAPRLSLRPVTQFLPNILGGEKAAPSGSALDVPAMSEKPRSNPFDDSVAPTNPFEDGAIVAGKTSPSHSQKDSWEGSEPPTPKSAKFGTAAAVPITATGAPAARGPNNVHRVQLDFKPSMEDELELRSGQLVRMLHEYDDGWALCIRLDRSQQGVCPRTCLSKLPVKPRPQGPPPNGPPGRPMGPPPPGMRRPASPQINNAMIPRPLTPTGRERANTLGRNSPAPHSPGSRPRSQSMSGMGERPMTPNSMPARKPVPGMAL